MATTFSQNKFQTIFSGKNTNVMNGQVFGKKVGVVTKLFGWWHEDVCRPFVSSGSA